MRSAHKFHIASSCAVVALSFLPCAALAQTPTGAAKARSRSAQTPDTPFFADALTRSTLGKIPNVDEQVPSEARMTPGPDGHIVILGGSTEVWCQPGKFIELKPKMKIVGFEAVTFAVWEDGRRTVADSVDHVPVLRIDPPVGGVNRKRVQVNLYDAQGNARPLLVCVVRARAASTAIAALDYKEHDEKCGFVIQDRASFPTTCLYLGNIYMGRVDENAGKVDMDERLLPPGKYSCQMVGKNTDGIYVPGASSEFTVDPRYTIDCAEAGQQIVIGEHDDEKLKVTVTHKPGLSIKKTRVYIAGNYAGEGKGDNFTLPLPTKNVPTGKCFIEVIGIADDGVTYPVESIPVDIKNEPWEQRLFNQPEYTLAKENLTKIDQLWSDVCYDLERAKYEPDVYRDTRTFTLESITDHYVVGKSAEYQAEAKRAFIQMTQLELQTARLYRTLKMRTKASSMFSNVARELGDSSRDAVTAKAELAALRKETTPTTL